MTKKKTVTKGITTIQKAFIGGAVLLAAIGLYMNHAKAADLLYAPKVPHVAQITSDGWYLAGRGGIGFGDDFSGVSFDNGYDFSGAIGYNWGEIGFASLRTEAEVGYFNQDGQLGAPFTGSVDGIYGLLNAYADFDTGTPLTPFIGAGAGYARVGADVSNGGFNLQATDSQFAYNLIAGLSYDLTKNVTLEASYKYLSINDVQFSTPFGSVTDDVNSHQVNAGLRVKL